MTDLQERVAEFLVEKQRDMMETAFFGTATKLQPITDAEGLTVNKLLGSMLSALTGYKVNVTDSLKDDDAIYIIDPSQLLYVPGDEDQDKIMVLNPCNAGKMIDVLTTRPKD